MFTLSDRTVYKADSIVAIIKKGRSDFLVEIRAEFLSFWTADCKRQKGCSKCSYLCFSLERHHGRCSVSENRHAAYFKLACENVLFVCLCVGMMTRQQLSAGRTGFMTPGQVSLSSCDM